MPISTEYIGYPVFRLDLLRGFSLACVAPNRFLLSIQSFWGPTEGDSMHRYADLQYISNTL